MPPMSSTPRGRVPRPLWTCPKCGVKLVTRNGWHSCGLATLADWQARMGPRAQRLYARFEEMIAACGDYHVAPARTRISFLARVRFANITRVSESGMTFNLALPSPARSRRFVRIEEVAPGWWVHWLRVAHAAELDAQVERWLRRSYHLIGGRDRL